MEFEGPSHGQIVTEIKTAGGRRCRYAYLLPADGDVDMLIFCWGTAM